MPPASPRAGLLINRNARGNRKTPGFERRARYLLDDDFAIVRATSSVDEVDGVLREFASANVNELAVSGGDGTIHYLYSRWLTLFGPEKPVPPLLVLGDGGMNMLFNDVGLAGSPDGVLVRWAEIFEEGRTPRRVQRNLIEVRFDGGDPVYCFTFTDGFIARFVLKYLETDGGPAETTKMILRFVADAVTRPEQAYNQWYKPLEAAYHSGEGVTPGGETLTAQTFCVASTIQTLILGFQLFEYPPRTGSHMGFMTYRTDNLYKTAASLPLVMWGRGRLRNWGDEIHLRQFGPRSLRIENCGLTVIDGEPYETGRLRTCELTLGPTVDITVV